MPATKLNSNARYPFVFSSTPTSPAPLQAERLEEERRVEAALRAELLQQLAETDRLEQLTAQKRRAKQLDHRQAVERLIQERRALREQERLKEQAEETKRLETVQRREACIQAEKRKLLEEAKTLQDFLPTSLDDM